MKNKTIYDLKMHETLTVTEEIPAVEAVAGSKVTSKVYEVTRVPGGWVYAFDYPMFRQSPIVFVPYHSEYKE